MILRESACSCRQLVKMKVVKRERGNTGIDTAITGTMKTVIGARGDVTATNMMRGDRTDIIRAEIDTGHTLAQDHHIDAVTIGTAMSAVTGHVATEIAVHLAPVRHAEDTSVMTARTAASHIQARDVQDLQDLGPGHHIAPGETITADVRGDLHLLTIVRATARSHTDRHPRI